MISDQSHSAIIRFSQNEYYIMRTLVKNYYRISQKEPWPSYYFFECFYFRNHKLNMTMYFILLLSSCLFSYTSTLYFHMGETEKKCFIEEIPDETMVTGKYRTQLYDSATKAYLPASPGIGMHVEVSSLSAQEYWGMELFGSE